jgi:hypothetical protein
MSPRVLSNQRTVSWMLLESTPLTKKKMKSKMLTTINQMRVNSLVKEQKLEAIE